ncbi:hypothetical protein [Peribacillus frigoritolerans]|uniref:hypothetical protein n=1 Tax=Peribacillus frigoritolerans TaxID=450367 RepID=UPI00207990AB|nr:hypothetical protein [Peribacillus frigoritolerans]USK66073.1 hypothetical protein LIT26_05380 [Peribacillus frigoritolerans]
MQNRKIGYVITISGYLIVEKILSTNTIRFIVKTKLIGTDGGPPAESECLEATFKLYIP